VKANTVAIHQTAVKKVVQITGGGGSGGLGSSSSSAYTAHFDLARGGLISLSHAQSGESVLVGAGPSSISPTSGGGRISPTGRSLAGTSSFTRDQPSVLLHASGQCAKQCFFRAPTDNDNGGFDTQFPPWYL
jgi:hypothetical protein